MKLIDNRFKLDKVVYDSLYSSLYQVLDLWENDKRLYLKLYNEERHALVIDYFINNFISLSKIKHENLLLNHQFNIINTIDGKKINIKQYYSTIEYIDAPSLDKVYLNLNFRERLNILFQVATVLDFLHYKGIVYRHLSPSNIYVLEDNSIKLMDLATVYEDIINTEYDDLTRNFMATEVLLQQNDIIG
ncbi:MAG: protein kinase, partial [Tissierellia bacterium]|nr:protein kinase [Tissierellia bacterium]